MRLLTTLLILGCLALLGSAAPPAGAQTTSSGSNVTITFPGNVVGNFAGVTWLNGPYGGSGPSAPFQMPNIAKMGSAVLAQGSFAGNPAFWDFYSAITMNTVARSTVTVSFTDQSGNNVTWVLNNAWPSKIQAVGPRSGDGVVQVGQLAVSFDSLMVQE